MEQPKVEESFMVKLLHEVEAFDASLFSPTDAIRPYEKYVGDCPPPFRKMYSLARYCMREIDQMELDHKYQSDHDDCSLVLPRLEIFKTKHDILMKMFWACVQDHFQTWGVDGNLSGVGLRREWKIVRTRSEENPLLELLKRIS